MPGSSGILDNLTANIIATVKPELIFDIGAGAGKYGKLVREIERLCNIKKKTTAVEIDESYISSFGLREIYDEVLCLDASQLIYKSKIIGGDMCILGDFIEHLPKSDGVNLLNYLLYRFKIVIVVVPVDMYQEEWMGHAQEEHISLWYASDFSVFPKCSIVKRFEGEGHFLLALLNGVQVSHRNQFLLIDEKNKVSMGYPYRDLHQITLLDQ